MVENNKSKQVICPECGAVVRKYKNPYPTVDIIISLSDNPDPTNVILIERKNPPFGWAIPGGFVDYGESVETTAVREAKEEVSLDIELSELLGVFSAPERDPRFLTVTTVFTATAEGKPFAADDAKSVKVFTRNSIPEKMAFDHRKILDNYYEKFFGKK